MYKGTVLDVIMDEDYTRFFVQISDGRTMLAATSSDFIEIYMKHRGIKAATDLIGCDVEIHDKGEGVVMLNLIIKPKKYEPIEAEWVPWEA